jgi:predicted DNA-binding protein (MmcQ/YjbR family)
MSKTDESKAPASLKPAIKFLREQALSYPETREDHPWGHSAFKVKGKVFLFLGADADGLGLSMKLPDSKQEALAMPFCEPTEYGLGKHGWVSATFPPDQLPPLELLMGWIDESYRAIAPKQVLKLLPAPEDNAIPGVFIAVGSKRKKAKKATKKRKAVGKR